MGFKKGNRIASIRLNVYESDGKITMENCGNYIRIRLVKRGTEIFKRDLSSLSKAKREMKRVVRRFLDGTLGADNSPSVAPPRPLKLYQEELYKRERIERTDCKEYDATNTTPHNDSPHSVSSNNVPPNDNVNGDR